MPRDTLQELVSRVLPTAPGGSAAANLPGLLDTLLGGNGQSLPDKLAGVSQQLQGLNTSTQTQSEATAANTQAVTANTSAQGGGESKSTARTIGNFAQSFFGSGFGLSPLLSGLIRLFTGGPAPQSPAPLTKFSLPPSITFNAANASGDQNGSIGAADYDQSGRPRAVGSSSGPALPPVTIQVAAMDSRSFLDHSAEIAQAVREAMLNMHGLNDVVNDL